MKLLDSKNIYLNIITDYRENIGNVATRIKGTHGVLKTSIFANINITRTHVVSIKYISMIKI
jgi:hypothetical protein